MEKSSEDYKKAFGDQIKNSKAPLDSYNPLKHLFFTWINPLVKIGYRQSLDLSMMPDIPKEFYYQNYTKKMNYHFEKIKKNAEESPNKADKFMILKLIFSCFKYDIIICLTLAILYSVLQYAPSYFIQSILEIPEYYEKSQHVKTFIVFASMLVIFKLVQFIANGFIFYKIDKLGIKTFFSLSNLTLDKAMKISFNQHPNYNIGEIINLGTVDSQKFSDITTYMLYMLNVPVSIGIGLYYLYKLMGFAMVIGLAVMLMLMAICTIVVRRGIIYQKKFMEVRSERINKTSEIFHNIKFIKTFCLEEFFGNKIIEVRREELKWLNNIFKRKVFMVTNAFLSPGLMITSMFVMYVWFGNTLTVAKIFTSISVFKTFQISFTFLPDLVANFINVIVSSERLAKFLMAKDINQPINRYDHNDDYDIIIRNGNFYYFNDKPGNIDNNNDINNSNVRNDANILIKDNNDKEDRGLLDQPLLNQSMDINKSVTSFKLRNINIEIKKGELVAIIGKSGSGKTSLMLSLLGELNYKKYDDFIFCCNPDIAYVSQKAWIRNNTLKENIIFGNEYNDTKYSEAIKCSGLEDDLKILEHGDKTIIGDKGTNLSGGQKTRVSIARAIYSNKEVVFMDDPLSALDINVGDFVFRNCINGYLKQKTRVVITHNIAYLKQFDKIIFMDKGEIVKFGTYNEIKELDHFKELIQILEETSLLKESKAEVSNKNIQPIVAVEKIEDESNGSKFSDDVTNTNDNEVAEHNMNEEMKELNNVNFKLVASFFGLTSKLKLSIVVVAVILTMMANSYLYVFYNEQGEKDPANFDKFYFFKMFITLQVLIIFFNFVRAFFIFLFSLDVSNKLNTIIIFRMLHASINKFFNRNPIGKVLNRLSGDIEKLDTILPQNFSFISNFGSCLVLNLFMVTFSSGYVILFFIIIYFVLVLMIQRYFAITNIKQTKLDSATKSPFYSLFSDVVNGIVDIRTYKKELFIYDNMKYVVNSHVRCNFVLSALRYWFSLIISMSSLIFIIPALAYVILFQDNFMLYIGILLTSIMEVLNYITVALTVLSNIENNFVAFDRCHSYMLLEPESGYRGLEQTEIELYRGREKLDFDSKKYITANWPTLGNIVFKAFSAKYSETMDYVLSNISINIKGGEKIGIIGRTGAGKTSMVMSLVRFFEHVEGTIQIDGVDIYNMDLKMLRSNITYISQDSYFFEGTLRNNLDPHHTKSDSELHELIQEADIIDEVTFKGGLDWKIVENGSNMSYGEKQILCFIRAIVELKKIIIMDEATSNLDIKSESIIEKMKEKYFRDRTTLTIAHRLNTIHQSDKILILERGQVRVFSPVKELKGPDLEYFEKYIKQLEEGIDPS